MLKESKRNVKKMLKCRIPHRSLAIPERGGAKIYSGRASPCLERNSLTTKNS